MAVGRVCPTSLEWWEKNVNEGELEERLTGIVGVRKQKFLTG